MYIIELIDKCKDIILITKTTTILAQVDVKSLNRNTHQLFAEMREITQKVTIILLEKIRQQHSKGEFSKSYT